MRQDPDRLAKLRQCLILDSSPEKVYDDLTRLLATGLDVPVTMVNLLDSERDWFKAGVGLTAAESPASTSLCELFFRENIDFLVVPDTTQHPLFAQHVMVRNPPHVRFYIGARLVVDGQTLGTLCAYDFRPRTVSADQLEQIRLLAAAAVALLTERLQNQR